MVATLNKSHPVYLYVAMLYVPRERERVCKDSVFVIDVSSFWSHFCLAHFVTYRILYIIVCGWGEIENNQSICESVCK